MKCSQNRVHTNCIGQPPIATNSISAPWQPCCSASRRSVCRQPLLIRSKVAQGLCRRMASKILSMLLWLPLSQKTPMQPHQWRAYRTEIAQPMPPDHQEAAQYLPKGCSRKCPLHFLDLNGVVCPNTLFSNTSALTSSLLFRANSTCTGSRTPRLVEHFWVPILGASCLNKFFVGTLRPSQIKKKCFHTNIS